MCECCYSCWLLMPAVASRISSSGGEGHRHARSQTMPIIRGKNALTNPKLLQMMETGKTHTHTCTHFDRYSSWDRFELLLYVIYFQMGIFRMETPWVPQISRQTYPPRCPSPCWMYWSSLFTITRSVVLSEFTTWNKISQYWRFVYIFCLVFLRKPLNMFH